VAFRKSLGGAVTLLIFAAIGSISPFLPYVSDVVDSINGWDSRDIFSAYEGFSAGPLLVLFGSLVALVVSIVIISNQNAGKRTGKVGTGVLTLVFGLVSLGGAGTAYQAWDSILVYEGEAANQGVGLWLGALSGLAVTVLGIIVLSVSKVTEGIR